MIYEADAESWRGIIVLLQLTGDAGIDIDVGFPDQYPALTAPHFDVIKATNLDSNAQSSIVQAMKDKSLKHVKKSQACLEPCIRWGMRIMGWQMMYLRVVSYQ